MRIRRTAACLVLAASLLTPTAPAAAAPAPPPAPKAANTPKPPPAAVAESDRDRVLGGNWRESGDRALTTSGDADGFRLLLADADQGYAWRTVATLSEPGADTDMWIGNACVTGSGRYAVAVYAPRGFTNDAVLADRGGYTAVVDLNSGAVRRLPVRASLAYFNPGCGAGDDAVLTQAGDTDLGRTRLIRVNARTGARRAPIEVPGQLTSALPAKDGIVAADNGAVVRVDGKGTRRRLAPTHGVAFRLTLAGDGGVVFMERDGDTRARVRHTAVAKKGRATTLAGGPLDDLDVTSPRGGRAYITGAAKAATARAAGVSVVDAPAGASLSSTGAVAITDVDRTGAAAGVTVRAKVLRTGATFEVTAKPAPARAAQQLQGDPGSPADFADRYCSVPRNDPRNQATQPKPRQVEWAVDQAVRGVLTEPRPANWKNLGMPAYTPQGLFPSVPLSGGGYVPAQIMLGIAAQESNMWQATRYALPGETANPLIGNYYGTDVYNSDPGDDWTIRWSHADCGYGVVQVTDHMRLAGREKGPDDIAWPYQTQRAVALDYATNVAAGLQILQRKWNQVYDVGMRVNNGDPSKIENWFFAVWAYNSGFHPDPGGGEPWGLGWSNNPANPKYPANRDSFMDKTARDATHPQDWPYPEKIMGWAGHPVEIYESPGVLVAGYRSAWWNGGDVDGPINRTDVKPPSTKFCDLTNDCAPGTLNVPDSPEVIGEPAGPCQHRNAAGKIDLKCWWHQSAAWKDNCALKCGNELIRFDPGYPYQADGNSYPPQCSLVSAGLPSNALIVDDIPDDVPSMRPGCTRSFANQGTFGLEYTADGQGQYPGKIDTHQISGGFGGHYWFAHARNAADNNALRVTGRWTLNRSHSGLMKVMVALPDHLARTPEALYGVRTTHGWRRSNTAQLRSVNSWMTLGTYRFDNVPEVRLTNVTAGGDSSKEMAFDAVAFIPIPDDQPNLKILHWNMAGSVRNEGAPDVVDRLVTEIRNTQPDLVSVNEMCETQYVDLIKKLDQAGYHMESKFHPSRVNIPDCYLHWISPTNPTPPVTSGNAVFARGTKISTKGYEFTSSDKLEERGVEIGDDRSVACMTFKPMAVDKDLVACSTHLAQENGTDYTKPEAQIRELARVFGPAADKAPFVLMGDFNRPPPNAALGTLYSEPIGTGVFSEVDEERNCFGVGNLCEISQGGSPTHGGHNGQKIDFVFVSRRFAYLNGLNVAVNTSVGTCGQDNHECSDHYLFHSMVMIPRG
ncbi:endonuclease/exonuclease/phosphatase family protein [Actinoplanes sp. NPDC051861]|uniref:endonuclease/exonuclease/phosphatase family protein n=1 Tax=Actinoplanes sp. NPDC051861 TaxID=3155170 RepID=UPI00341BA38E